MNYILDVFLTVCKEGCLLLRGAYYDDTRVSFYDRPSATWVHTSGSADCANVFIWSGISAQIDSVGCFSRARMSICRDASVHPSSRNTRVLHRNKMSLHANSTYDRAIKFLRVVIREIASPSSNVNGVGVGSIFFSLLLLISLTFECYISVWRVSSTCTLVASYPITDCYDGRLYSCYF